MDLDKRLINLRIDVIERNLAEIRNIAGEGKAEFQKSYRTRLAARHALLESIEACIDMANHIIASMGLRRPEDYKDVFVILEENSVLPKVLSEKLQNMAKFRNLLVHFYTKLDDEQIFTSMSGDTKDITEFVKLVLKFSSKK